ncbi:hypothetical protein N7466_004780 [Penicillium verhagenii]|uniref:uncharacterized protein n=1 Tax=Penicillium verhagenii TaxID=1562060 RepID=UPI002544E7EB|nr:uncharacterized protein N7466_004780 [Penicillium verhagenii]KAJ5935233.1 hypothetical protein N7466_004780 [Penicillium verhagenii]
MSSFPEDQPLSSQFLPPPSAQARGSLFGGPSSDADPPSSRSLRPRRSIFGGLSSQDVRSEPDLPSDPMVETISDEDEDEDELDMILQERPLEYYDSDGESSYAESSDDEARNVTLAGSSLVPKKLLPEKVVRKPKEIRQEPTYVVYRGIDLPPGQKRPNRWAGIPINYDRAIAGERGVYQSVMDSRAQDLAAHLYNVYVVRQQPRQQDESGEPEESDEEKALRKRWVAWPIPAGRVPRAGESAHRKLDGPDTFRMPPDDRFSGELEECIIATMMKTGKERFMARKWVGEEDAASLEEIAPDPDAMEIDVEGTTANKETNPQDDRKTSGESHVNSGTDANDGANVSGETNVDDEMNDNYETVDNEKRSTNDGESKEQSSQADKLRPIVQTDDDLSRRLLRPLSRTAISQLDQLLMGLHHSLRHRTKEVDDSDDSATDTDDDVSRSRSKGRKHSQSRGRKRSRGQTQSGQSSRNVSNLRSSPHTENEQHDLDDYPDAADRSAQRKARLLGRLPLRDWGEVMGLASMVGLPSNVVQRAAKRCADLFEQDMTFRTFHEGRVMKVRVGSKRDYDYVESDPEDLKSQEYYKHTSQSRNSSKGPARSTSRQPHPTPSISHAPPAPPTISVSNASSANQRVTQKQNLAKHPGFKNNSTTSTSQGFTCPVSSCSRSHRGFSRTWNLNQHIKNRHPEYLQPDALENGESQAPIQNQPSNEVIDLS